MYRKIRKADWVAECKLCGTLGHSVDEFGAYALDQRHPQSMGHVAKALDSAFANVQRSFQRVGDTISEMLGVMRAAVHSVQSDFALVEFAEPGYLTPGPGVSVKEEDGDARV